MFTINIKGKENPKSPQLVKLEAIFFKTGYARVTKSLSITGLLKDWDSQTQQFKSKGVEASEKTSCLSTLKPNILKLRKSGMLTIVLGLQFNGHTVSNTNRKSVYLPRLFLFLKF